MSKHYTDADVRNLAETLRSDYDTEHDASHLHWQDFAEQAAGLLDAVAPAIAARALREEAGRVESNRNAVSSPIGQAPGTVLVSPTYLRRRADEIEAGR